MAVVRTKEVTLVEAWGNDEGGVTVALGKRRAHLTVEEAAAFALELGTAAADALRASQETFAAERSLAEYRDRMRLDDAEAVI